ncbi:YihY family inner membrane protein [Corynebacterium phoceense]|uniref:YhjD/YihY/BrkB family envelope integrity protein n=1 Tax=Corynebacterium phoceense TaxID=1686286 RepID=UPI00211CECE0|nr:YhjD/YihY/BrkB family envelope integrity protein [Corynebacterium phoceense]MCQ9334648.1 YihY family inner membrane protein [Corynebacterium phoceense]
MTAASSPSTKNDEARTDVYGIERAYDDEPGAVDKVRERSPFVDHIMRTLDRYGSEGGNQFAAATTYYSVLAIFPLLMLLTAGAATVLASRPDLFQQLQDQITESVSGDLGSTLNEVLETAVDQRGAMFGIGGLTTLWSGLGWMNNLRVGISAMWKIDANEGGSFIQKKLSDLLGLIGLLVALVIAFGVTAAGSSGLTQRVLDWVGIESFPGMNIVIFLVGLVVGLIANFLVFWWLIVILPRTKVPKKSGLMGALIGAVAFEVLKQLSTVIMSSAAGNPAGAVFGPVIVLMVVMYLVWRVVLYVSAWTATTDESLVNAEDVDVPAPAIIRVRNEVKSSPSAGTTLGIGAALGAVGAGLVALLRRK